MKGPQIVRGHFVDTSGYLFYKFRELRDDLIQLMKIT